jgi:hypothetical protein
MLRAKVYESTGEIGLAMRDWRAVADLPDAPSEMRAYALGKLVEAGTPTANPS